MEVDGRGRRDRSQARGARDQAGRLRTRFAAAAAECLYDRSAYVVLF
jgi:hypothetical protein